MKKHQKVIIELLKSSMNNKKIEYHKKDNINWEKVIKEADNHKISSLIYSAIDKKSFGCIDKQLLEAWKRDVLISNLEQHKMINNLCKFLAEMNEEGIGIIVLKGLVLRNYYPQCDLRSMSDADILVHKSDYEKVKLYLINNGYEIVDSNCIHECFVNEQDEEIELHWQLVNNDYFIFDIKAFEDNIWMNSIECSINGIKCRTLGNEDFIIHLLIHMIVHSKYDGFGLRQLYDLGVFIKNKNSEIDWKLLKSKAEKYSVLKFSIGIFLLINKIFDVDIPEIFLCKKDINDVDLDLILKNSLLSGIYGNRERYEDFSELYEYQEESNKKSKKLNRFRRLIFPTCNELFPRYEYAKRHIYLLPVAWVHRLVRCLFLKYGIRTTIIFAIQSFKLGNMRRKIVKIFDL